MAAPVLRRHVCGFEWRGDERVSRRGVHDAAPLSPLHPGNDGVDGMEIRREIYCDYRVPFFRRESLYRLDVLDARVVDEDIHFAEFPVRVLDHAARRAGHYG
jgi:hypothetical protein